MDELLREMEEQGLTLDASSLSYGGKDRLYRRLPVESATPGQGQEELWSIARMEGDLSQSQEEAFDSQLEENPALAREWKLVQASQLPALEISYPGKAGLKKNTPGNRRLYWLSPLAAAAAIALALILFRGNPEVVVPQVVDAIGEQGDEIKPTVESATQDTPELASESVLPSFRRNPEPAELTGEKKGPPVQEDSTAHSQEARSLAREPVRLALTPRAMVRPDRGFSPDRIQGLDIPAESARKGGLDWNKISMGSTRLASAGVKQINRMTGSDLNLDVSRNEEGKLKSFSFRTGLFNVESSSDRPD